MKKCLKAFSLITTFCLLSQVVVPFAGVNATGTSKAIDIAFPDFSDASVGLNRGLVLSGISNLTADPSKTTTDVAIADNKLQLTAPDTADIVNGAAFTSQKVQLGTNNSFSTFFSFDITPDASNVYPESLLFVMHSSKNVLTNKWFNGAFSYTGDSNWAAPAPDNSNGNIAVEFDTNYNGPAGTPPSNEPNDNHVALDLNGNFWSEGTPFLSSADGTVDLKDGNTKYCWIDYDGSKNPGELTICVSETPNRNDGHSTTRQMALSGGQQLMFLNSTVYVGFEAYKGSASTAACNVKSWYFTGAYDPIDTSTYTYTVTTDVPQEELDQLIANINNLPALDQIGLANYDTVMALNKTYMALNDKQKGDITNADALTSAVAKINQLLQPVTDLTTKINALPVADDVTLENADDVNAANDAYQALTDDVLPFLDSSLATKLADDVQAVSDQQAVVDDVITQINDLPDAITLSYADAVENADDAFQAVPDVNKKFVTNSSKLDQAKVTITTLMQPVTDLQAKVAQLPDKDAITLSSQDAVDAAKDAYDALTDELSALVDNGTVTKLNADIQALKDQQALVDDAFNKIKNLPDAISLSDKDAVVAARAAYEKVIDGNKSLITNYTKLTGAEATIVSLSNATISTPNNNNSNGNNNNNNSSDTNTSTGGSTSNSSNPNTGSNGNALPALIICGVVAAAAAGFVKGKKH